MEGTEITFSQQVGIDDFFALFPPEGAGAYKVLTTEEIFGILRSDILDMNNLDVVKWLVDHSYEKALLLPPAIGMGWKVFPSFQEE
jgi:hypothetical protein